MFIRELSWLQRCIRMRIPRRLLPGWLVLAIGLTFVVASIGLSDAALSNFDALLLVLNALPWVLLWLLAWGISGKGIFSATLVSVMHWLFQAVQTAKISNLNLPIMPGDVVMIGNVVAHGEMMSRYVEFGHGWLFALLLIALLGWLEPAMASGRGRIRLALVIPAILLLAGMVAGVWPWRVLYGASDRDFPHWDPVATATSLGGTYYLMYASLTALPAAADVDESRIASFVERHGAQLGRLMEGEAIDELPDIVVIQSEAYFDPARLNGIETDDVCAGYRKLAALGLHGNMTVPTFGGLTTRTEFEFLSGIPLLTAYSNIQHPFAAFRLRPMNSLASELRKQGYLVRGVHPNDPGFYNRGPYYRELGFNSFHGIREFLPSEKAGLYVGDAALLSRIPELLSETGPTMVMAVTMENHSPWDDQRDESADPEGLSIPAGLDKEDANQLARYLRHQRNADSALITLWEVLRQRSRPAILIFYGDHLPALGRVYESLGFKDGKAAGAQPVPWLVVDTRGRISPARFDLSSYQLAATALKAAGLPMSRYFSAINVLGQVDPNSGREIDDSQAILVDLARSLPWRDVPKLPEPTPRRLVSDLANFVDWGPKQVAIGDPIPDEGLSMWFKSDKPLPRDLGLRLGAARLRVYRGQSADTLLALVPKELLGKPGRYPINAISSLERVYQPVASITVQARKERVVLHGGRAANLCAIDNWGPGVVSRSAPPARLPDGGFGIFVTAGCVPPKAGLLLDGQPLTTSQSGNLVTASAPFTVLQRSGSRQLSILDRDNGEKLVIGQIEIRD